jgi:LPS sulfotransferase NodH
LDYDFEKIDYWYQHILEHEHGWQEFFSANCISPLVINYHDICCDWQAVVKKIARFMELPNSAVEVVEKTTPILNSPFKKIGDERNALWAERFCLEKMHKGERIRSSLCSTDLSSPKTKKDWSALNSYQEITH